MAAADAAGPLGLTAAEVWDGARYAGNTAHHSAFDDDDVLAGTQLGPGQDVLDIGCRVEDLTARVADLVAPGGSVLALDAAPGMIAEASRPSRPRLEFAVCAAQDLDAVVAPASVDVVLSVATPRSTPISWTRRGSCSAGAHVRLVHQRRDVPDADAMLGWLRSQVLVAYPPDLADDDVRGLVDGPGGAPVCRGVPAAGRHLRPGPCPPGRPGARAGPIQESLVRQGVSAEIWRLAGAQGGAGRRICGDSICCDTRIPVTPVFVC